MKDIEFLDITKRIFRNSYIEEKPSYNMELMRLSIKSLVPSLDKVGNYIDYNRYLKELALWKYYRSGTNTGIENIFISDKLSYFSYQDKKILDRIYPLILTNTDWEVLKDEILKNLILSTGNIFYILENLLISKFFYLLLNGYKEILSFLKEEVIYICQEDFMLEYFKYFRIKEGTNIDKLKIDFELSKIQALNILNGSKGSFKDLNKILNFYKLNNSIGNYELLKKIFSDDSTKLDEVDENFSNYILDLRKSRINPEALKIKEYVMPDIFLYEEGDIFFHSLFNKVLVTYKSKNDKNICVNIKTKSGDYILKKPIN